MTIIDILSVCLVISGLAWLWLGWMMYRGVLPLSCKLEETLKAKDDLSKQLTQSENTITSLEKKLVETDSKLTELTTENKNLQSKLSETNTKLDSCTNALNDQ